MAILANDVKLVASRVMDDVPEGGGAPTANIIADGASNAIFPDISELDRAGGDVSFRKVFIHVQTSNTDTYLGSNVIVAEPPEDPNVTVTLFNTGETFDDRDSASSRVESYLVAGPEWPGYLLENHVVGQRVVALFQRPSEATPNIGETLILVWHEGLSDQREQYVRVIDVSTVVRTYTSSTGKTYEAAVVSCELSDPLRFNLPGSPPNEYYQRDSAGTKVRETTVGDAAVYAGVSKTTDPVAIGDISASVESVFTQLVPSAQTEIPLVDQSAAGQSTALAEAADGSVSYTTSQPFNSETTLSLGNAVTPGTLAITIGAVTLTDTGGQVYDGATVVGLVDYARGLVSFPTLSATYSGGKTVSFYPAAAPLRVADTGQITVTPETRAYNYALTIEPVPAPGSVVVSYRSQGRWYDLRDNGSGVLSGSDLAYGVGSINYTTGTASVTLGALPDDGSAIMFAWGSKVDYINRASMETENPSVRFQLSQGLVEPGSVTITWNDGTARTASDDGKGVISGSATGTINYETGLAEITPTNLPAGGQQYTVAYSVADPAAEMSYDAAAPTRNVNTTITIDLGQTNITPGTVRLTWPIELAVPNGMHIATRNIPSSVSAKDDGNGNIIVSTGRNAGSINYATGIINMQPDGPVVGSYTYYAASFGPGYLLEFTP